MMTKRRLYWVLSAGAFVLVLSVLALVNPADGQIAPVPGPGIKPFPPQPDPVPPPKKETSLSAQYGAIQLIENTTYSDFLAAARDCIKDKVWGDAAKAMQAILANGEDYYVKVVEENAAGNKTERWTSVKYEANKLVGSMPAEGLKVYEDLYGRIAEIELDNAKKSGDVQKLAGVAQQYFHTKAGLQANDILATFFLDRGQFFQAALQFDRMLTLSAKQAKISPMTLFKATIAFRRTGDLKRSDEIFKQLLPQLKTDGGLKIGKQLVAIEKLENMLKAQPKPQMINPKDWPLVRGDLTSTAQTLGTQPLLGEILWKRTTVRDKFELTNEIDPDGGQGQLIKDAIKGVHTLPGVPVMPGFFPVAVEGKLVYRTYAGLTAVHLKDVKDPDGKVSEKAGDIAWKGIGFEGSLANSLTKSAKDTLHQFVNNFRPYPDFMAFVYENTLVGTLSADLKQVYAIDDIAIPVPPNMINQLFGVTNPFGGVQPPAFNSDVKKVVLQNGLYAYDIQTGKNVWSLGLGDSKKRPEFEDSHFLGPPLPVGGKLYVLNEMNNGNIRLFGLDPISGAIVSEQKLGTVEDHSRFVRDPNRRIHAVHLAYGEGILVCPTNCGDVLGIDLLSKSLAWAYPYREGKKQSTTIIAPGPIQPFPPNNPLPVTAWTWKVAPPAIAGGKVVFTAPDADALHCVNLRDGTQAWRMKKKHSDLFMAGVWDNKVIVVGSGSCYALDLHTGSRLWSVTLSDRNVLPSGQGVASNNIYYLPMADGEIIAIDIVKGAIKSRNRPSGNVGTPGNLVFHEGIVVSQTLEEIIVYPQLTTKLEEIELAYKKAPGDVNKMLQLGELRLANGEIKEAVKLFYQLKAKNPGGAVQNRLDQKLYEALTDLFQVDFGLARADYLNDYEALCKLGDDVEKQKRQANLYRLLGSGLEAKGDLVGAFEAYTKFGSLPLYQKDGIPDKDDPLRKVPAQVWFRGRLSAMFSAAKPEQKKPLEDKIWQKWQQVSKTNDLNELRGFVSMFDVNFKVGQEARLQLANFLIERGNPDWFLEAELLLEQLRSSVVVNDKTGKSLVSSVDPGAKALEALARLEKKRAPKLATEYYRQLAELFPNDEIRDGKTGKTLLDELATDKTLLPYLEGPAALWGSAKFKFKEPGANTVAAGTLSGMLLTPRGELNPATSQLRVVLEPITFQPKLRVVDLTTNKDLWVSNPIDLNSTETQSQVAFKPFSAQFGGNSNLYPHAHFRQALTKGHLTVVQVGTMAYALDLSRTEPGKSPLLWKHSLITEHIPPNINTMQSSATVDGHGHLQLVVKTATFPQKIVNVRVGYVAAVQASYVALVQQDNLLIIDSLSDKAPRVLWSRPGISENTEIFGDDQYIYMVDVINGVAVNGQALRAADGTSVNIPDFSAVYQKRLHQFGSQIVATGTANNQLVLRLYDIPSGKDLWKEAFHIDTVVLKTVDPFLAGVIEPNGKLTVVDLKTRQIATQGTVLHGRVTKADLKNLTQPLLVADRDYFYVALNQPLNANVISGGVLASNFANGLRCETVNGWFGSFHRQDGSKKVGDKTRTWKKGDLHWYSSEPVTNQLMVVELFDALPLVVFSAHYHEKHQGPGLPINQWVSRTYSIDKATGKWVYYPFTPRVINTPSPSFQVLTVDPRGGTINLVGLSYVLQHYVDDGRPPQVGLAPIIPPPVVQIPGINPIPPMPAFTIAKIEQMAVKLAAVAAAGGQSAYSMNAPGIGLMTLRSGNPPTIEYNGQPPVPVTLWLSQVKKQ